MLNYYEWIDLSREEKLNKNIVTYNQRSLMTAFS